MKNLFYSALSVLAIGGLASCSSNEPVVGGDPNADEAYGYMAVNLKNAGIYTPSNRAAEWGDPEYREGEGVENAITAENIRFYFFAEDMTPFRMNSEGINGTVTSTNMVKPINIVTTNTDGPADTGVQGVLVLGTPAEGYKGQLPSKVICVANSSNFEQYANENLKAVLGKFEATPTDWTQPFVMTSSTYFDADGKLVYYTDIAGKIKKSVALAQEDPANIFIERLAAKIQIIKGIGEEKPVMEKDQNGNLTQKKILVRDQGDPKELYVKLTGWQPYLTADKAFGLKNLEATWATSAPFEGWTDWNKADYHRSFWAVSGLANYQNSTYDLYNETQFTRTTDPYYTYENTMCPNPASASDASDRSATAMIVRAKVYQHEDDGSEHPIDFMRWGGDYYLVSYLKEIIVKAYNSNLPEGAEQAVVGDVNFKLRAGTNYYMATVKGNDYADFDNILWWKDGVTSYIVNVEHHSYAAGTEMKSIYGVVRNHIYEYELNNVIGLGIPGNTPDQPTEEEASYLSAAIYVLNWHVVSHKIDLE